MSDCPCRGCSPPKRNAYCHGQCKDYIEWKKKLQIRRQKEKLDSDIAYMLYSKRTPREKHYAEYIYKKIK